MTTRVTVLPDSIPDVATFRAFCQTFHDNFAATGMQQTADTGQINIATVAKPASGTVVAGYEIWRFTDYWADVAPIYVKVEYAASTGVNNPQLWFTVGTGSDGAGALTYTGWPGATTVISRREMARTNTSVMGAQPGPVYFTHLSDQSWAFLAWPSSVVNATGTWFFAVERFRNPDGSTSPDGVSTFFAQVGSGTTPTAYQDGRFYRLGAPQPASAISSWVSLSANWPTEGTLFGTTLYPVPVFTGVGPRMASPSQLVVALGQLDMAADQMFPMLHYGIKHQWVCAGPGNLTDGFGNIGGSTARPYESFAMRAD